MTITKSHNTIFIWLFISLLFNGALPTGIINRVSYAQITLDGSLGETLSLTQPDYVISDDMGQVRGSNLFHSFGEFNIRTGESMTFTGPDLIENIIGRVTGGNQSFIDGVLRSDISGANLYLLNPSGVMFGPNASLDISGSFHVSTADYIRFEDGETFYADLSENSVLTVALPETFGFLNTNPAGLAIRESVLELSEREILSIVGGDISIAGDGTAASGGLKSPGGLINIVSLASSGEVIMNAAGESPGLSVDASGQLGSVILSKGALVDVSGDNTGTGSGGTVLIRGGSFIVDNSLVSADTQGNVDGAAIAVDINVHENMVVRNGGRLHANSGNGRAGDITLDVDNLTVAGSSISAESGGAGKGSNITINASESVSLIDSRWAISVTTYTSGDGGIISIATPYLTLDKARINVTTYGAGNAGNLSLEVDRLTLTGDGRLGGIATWSGGAGRGGNVTVNASESVSISDSAITGTAGDNGEGGVIWITAPSLTMSNGGMINASTVGEGNAGSVTLQLGKLALTGGSSIATESGGLGKGGNVNINASESISIIDSRWAISGTSYTSGDGGIISIATPYLTLDKARINVTTYGAGNAGNLSLEVDRLTLTGDGRLGGIATWSDGAGRGGNVTVNASDSVSISDSAITGTAGDNGEGGIIWITAPSLTMSNGGMINASTVDEGNAGSVTLQLGNLALTAGSSIATETGGPGKGGDLTVHADESVSISDSVISSSSTANGNGGTISIATDELTMDISSLVEARTSEAGAAGSISINMKNIYLTDKSSINTESRGAGHGGTIFINALHSIGLKDSSITAATTESDGGNIHLRAAYMLHTDKSRITAAAGGGTGSGGNIDIDPVYVILEKSDIIANAYEGHGGNIQISANVFLADPDSVVSASSERGINGEVDIRAPINNISGSIASLKKNYLSAAALLSKPCTARLNEGSSSSLIVRGRDGLPAEPGGFLPSPVYLERDAGSERSMDQTRPRDLTAMILSGFENKITTYTSALTYNEDVRLSTCLKGRDRNQNW